MPDLSSPADVNDPTGFEALFAEAKMGMSPQHRRLVLRLLEESLGSAKAVADYFQKECKRLLARCERLAQDPETDPAELAQTRKLLGMAIGFYQRAAEKESKFDRKVTLARDGLDEDVLREGEAVRRVAYAQATLKLREQRNRAEVLALADLLQREGLDYERRQHALASFSNGSPAPAAWRQTRSRSPRSRRMRLATAASRDGPSEPSGGDEPPLVVHFGGRSWLLADGIAIPIGQDDASWWCERPDDGVLGWLLRGEEP